MLVSKCVKQRCALSTGYVKIKKVRKFNYLASVVINDRKCDKKKAETYMDNYFSETQQRIRT